MYKIFTLAAAAAIMPLSQKIFPPEFNTGNIAGKQVYVFPYKNTVTIDPFVPEKKTTEPWSQNWVANAQENIRKSEYHFTWEEKLKAYCTPNRKNNLRFFYTDKGFSVEPRTTQIAMGDFDPMKMPDEIKYKSIPNWKIKFNLDKKQVGKGSWEVTENKAEYVTKNITVQYINNDEGMRQNFIVHKPFANTYELKINLSINTTLKVKSTQYKLLFFHKSKNVLNYEDLKVWDAAGKPLLAYFKKNKSNRYYIQVDAKDAVYPITIDPISTTPATALYSKQSFAEMGHGVSSAGDVNGDGYSDVLIGVPYYDNVQLGEGAGFLYHGSATGIGTTPNTIITCGQFNAFLGWSTATAGDVNGDGYSDVIIGAFGYNNGQIQEGVAFVYHGSPIGINTTPMTLLECNRASADFGTSVASAGDVNGDGYSDVIVGAWDYTNDQSGEGAAFLYHGSATGIIPTAAAFFENNQANAAMGISVASAGDVNGDGYSDIIIGSHAYNIGGGAFVYHGSAAGISTIAADTIVSTQANERVGFSVASAGDVNGDGYSDVIVGAYFYDNGQTNEGAAFIYHGSATGINTSAAATVECDQANANMGYAVASAGDINGDGYSDVVVGAYLYDNIEANEGAVFVYYGSAGSIGTTAVAMLESNQVNAFMGMSVASAGDINGDGYSDLVVGAPQYTDSQTREGAAFVYHGSAAGLSATPNNTPDDADLADVNFGYSVASAGDVNSDGYSDVIIGAPQYDEGANANVGRAYVYYGSATGLGPIPNITLDETNQALSYFGWSVASAGDVNGDGYSDVIVGSSQYDDGPNANEGRAYVYHGSAAGLSLTANSVLDDANQAGASFGLSVSSAGDVNGDGYSDVIIGAYQYDDGFTNEGVAFVYHGSATGLSAVPNSMPDDANQLNANFGFSVSSAGDVNGDGYSDVIIGAISYDDAFANEGRAFVYHGSAAGLSATPNNTPDDADQANANFGNAVACAGDVNGDGYSDVIIGANSYDVVPFSNEGVAFVYHGSATGLSAVPNSTLSPVTQVNAIFGQSVACAGDVNGDGYSDVIVGAYLYDDGANSNEGVAFVFHGSSSGLLAAPGSMPDDANQAVAMFGQSVASAGDINGDGYSDVIIGAPGYTDGANVGEGRAFVYHGNDPVSNNRNNLRLYNTDLVTPINNSNFILSDFGAGLYARSFLGKAKGKMVWETRMNYNAYSGTPITNSTFFTGQQAAYTDMGLAGIEIKNRVSKILGARYTKLRARIKYDPVTAITGQVYSPWRNVSSIMDANNLGVLPIELISFNAAWIQKGKTARLDFKTDKESGICCFDIEKSADGFHFYTIGSLPAKNISGIQSYSFIDNNATNKKQFYRLKIKGIAGQVDYSNIQQLQNNGATEILVFPNPTTDVLQLQLNRVYDKMNVQIINNAGQIVKQMNAVSVISQVVTIPVQNLAPGNYWLRLQGGDEKQVLQFVKQ